MKQYPVWDPALRLFHWALAAGFIANAAFTDPEAFLHEWIGYAILFLVGFRLLWGLVGPRAARFASFLPTGTAVMAQIGDIATHRHRAHLGHSPLGALMILNLLATFAAIGLTGHMMTTNAFWGVEWVEEAHEMLVTWAEISVILHLAGVFWESRRTGVNLARSMITGRKDIPEDVNLIS